MIELFRKEIDDQYSQENFRLIQESINDSPFEKGHFKFFEVVISSAATNYKYPHHLPFVPKDVIMTSVSPSATVTWNYSLFDRTNLNITTSGPTTIRALIGRYGEN